ncbi:hypothetical protein RAS2_20880 [Phycisphaerae bacterium RAS2]|nr:hypothetical protein RAS2_20880 [Phycisphaerae bacterium RAS2]
MNNSSTGVQQSRGQLAARRASDAAGQDALLRYLSMRSEGEPAWFEIKDDDELNSELSTGRFATVLFADLDALWEMVWKNHADMDRWDAAGVKIELARSPSASEWQALIRDAHASLLRHRAKQSRRQTIAATILSLVAVASLAALLILR